MMKGCKIISISFKALLWRHGGYLAVSACKLVYKYDNAERVAGQHSQVIPTELTAPQTETFK